MAGGDDDLDWLPDTGAHLTRDELEVVLRALRDLVRSTDGEMTVTRMRVEEIAYTILSAAAREVGEDGA